MALTYTHMPSTPRRAAGSPTAAIILLLLVAVCGRAGEYRFDMWDAEAGLPQNSVQAILQTRDGYLWLATADGLVRYDGVRFTVFNKGNSPGLRSNRLTTLYEARDGALWAGTETGDVTRYRGGTFVSYAVADGLPGGHVLALREDAEGRLVVFAEAGVARARVAGDASGFVAAGGLPAGLAQSLQRGYSFGQASFYADGGNLWHFHNGAFENVSARVQLPPPAMVADVFEDQDATLWLLTKDARLLRVREGFDAPETVAAASLPRERIRTVHAERDGNIWIGTDAGLYSLHEGVLDSFIGAAATAPARINSLYEDAEGNLWIGSFAQGLHRLRRRAVAALTEQDGLALGNVYPLLEGRDGNVWIGTWGRGLDSYRDGKVTHYPLAEQLALGVISSLCETREGALWIGSTVALRLKDGKFTRFGVQEGLDSGFIFDIHEARDGRMWFAAEHGLYEFDGSRFRRYTEEDGLAHERVQLIAEDRAGDLWLGTLGGLCRLRAGSAQCWRESDGLASDNVRSLYEDADGILWVGTYDGGLTRLKDGRLFSYTSRDGLYSDGVFQILEDGRGNLWMSSNRGVYVVSRGELNAFAEGRISRITSLAYTRQDGLPSVECNGGRQPAGFRGRDGRFWFPTQAGVAVIDPEAVQFNPKPPPVVVESCMVDRRAVDFRDGLVLAPGRENLEIQYTGLSFTRSEGVHFKYRLEGLDRDWVEAGTRRTAYYSHLPPGTYTFRVAAANSDGVWNEEGARLLVTVLPPFWRTWWFVAISFVFVAGVSVAAYERRLARARRAHAAQAEFSRKLIASQEAERKRIAAELHDGLGQSLAIIKNRALLSLNSPGDHERAAEQLGEIATAAAEAIDEVKEIAYNLRPYQLDRLGLTRALEAMLLRVAAPSGLRLNTEVEMIDGLLPSGSEINLYRVVQEGVSNILKHAQATEAHVAVRRSSRGGVEITIRDNGKGFDPTRAPAGEGSPRGGFGLLGIGERVRMLGGHLQLTTTPGRGTVIRIMLDGAAACDERAHGG
jgi:signal transduction histidine kinase/ligand-binding sensor domain-containing protein